MSPNRINITILGNKLVSRRSNIFFVIRVSTYSHIGSADRAPRLSYRGLQRSTGLSRLVLGGHHFTSEGFAPHRQRPPPHLALPRKTSFVLTPQLSQNGRVDGQVLIVLNRPSGRDFYNTLTSRCIRTTQRTKRRIHRLHLNALDFSPVLHRNCRRVRPLRTSLLGTRRSVA